MKFFLLLVISCSHFTKPHSLSEEFKKNNLLNLSLKSSGTDPKAELQGVKIRKNGPYYQLTGAENFLNNKSQMTFSIWLKPIKHNGIIQDIISFSIYSKEPTTKSRFSLRLQSQNRLTTVIRTQDNQYPFEITTIKPIEINKWGHVLVTFNLKENRFKIFYNSVELETRGRVRFKDSSTDASPSSFVTMGAEDDGSTNFFEGHLRHLMIWDREFLPNEAKNLFSSIKIGF